MFDITSGSGTMKCVRLKGPRLTQHIHVEEAARQASDGARIVDTISVSR